MSKNNRPVGLDYYSLYLLNFLRESHPEKAGGHAFIEERAERAAEVYEQHFREGYGAAGAQELAIRSLLEGLHFSRYDMLRHVLTNEFGEEVPEKEIDPLALRLLPRLEHVFSIYEPTDDFAQSPEYDLLYTRLTGEVALYLEEHGI